ncbi:MAG TPA: nuclear transport factor 2 family protein [Gemmatimonadaceae bacterium]|nr:nuclear transport factor 2 family protein [Gemmatimonadaceae bacterium]
MNSRIVVAFAIALQLAATHAAAAQAAAASKPAAPSASVGAAVVAQEQAILDAIARSDTLAFNKALGSDFVYVDVHGAVRWQLSKTSANLPACVLGTGWSLDHPMTTEVGTDLVVLTYSSSGKAMCDGHPAPSPVNSMSVWRKRGGRWLAVAHSETPATASQAKP